MHVNSCLRDHDHATLCQYSNRMIDRAVKLSCKSYNRFEVHQQADDGGEQHDIVHSNARFLLQL